MRLFFYILLFLPLFCFSQPILKIGSNIVMYGSSPIICNTSVSIKTEITTTLLNNSRTIITSSVYQSRIPYGFLKFTTFATELKIKVNPTILTVYPYPANIGNQILVEINGIKRMIYPIDTSYTIIAMAAGSKTIKIVEGLVSKPSGTQIGTYLMDIITNNTINILYESSPSQSICFLGNSIENSATTDSNAVNGFAISFREKRGLNTTIEGYGYGTLNDFTSSDEITETTALNITSHLIGVDSNKVVIALGTNDYALKSISSTIFGVRMDSLLRKINRINNNIKIYVISPIARVAPSSENEVQAGWGNLGAYRTAAQTACNGKVYVTYINGQSLVSAINMYDGVHPNNNGHIEFYNNIKNIIAP